MEQNALFKWKAALAAVCGAFTAAFGWLGWLSAAWVLCMLLDWATGSAAAAARGAWSSTAARQGIWHKAGMLLVVLAAALTDGVLGLLMDNAGLTPPLAGGALLCPIVLCWYIFTELGSVLENAQKMGAPVPAALTRLLAQARDSAAARLPESVQTSTGAAQAGTNAALSAQALSVNVSAGETPGAAQAPTGETQAQPAPHS
jgi:phage-related holin